MFNLKKNAIKLALIGALGFSSVSQAAYVSAGASVSFNALIDGFINSTLESYQMRWNTVFGGMIGGTVPSSILMTTTNLVTRITEIEISLIRRLDQSDMKLTSEFKKAANTLRERIIKTTQADIQKKEAISHYRTNKERGHEVAKMVEDFEQPITNCLQYSAGKNFSDGALAPRLMAADTAAQVGSSVAYAQGLWDLEEFETNRKVFTGENRDNDMQSGALFGSTDGKLTRQSAMDSQSVASAINYLVGLAYVPKSVGKDQDDSNSGKLYSRLQRQYAAYSSLSSYVLSTVASYHAPQKELLSFYRDAGLNTTAEQEQNGVSLAELYDTYTRKLLSEPQVKANAQASSLTILRNMAQMDGMALYMDVQELQQLEQLEAMKAAELSLLTHKVIGPQVELYRTATKK